MKIYLLNFIKLSIFRIEFDIFLVIDMFSYKKNYLNNKKSSLYGQGISLSLSLLQIITF